jgi:hypothetical protein
LALNFRANAVTKRRILTRIRNPSPVVQFIK